MNDISLEARSAITLMWSPIVVQPGVVPPVVVVLPYVSPEWFLLLLLSYRM